MASIMDNAVSIGIESTYGTKAAATIGFETQVDDWEFDIGKIESTGFRAGQHTMRANRTKTIPNGASGSIEFDALDSGLWHLFPSMVGSVTSNTVDDSVTTVVFDSESDIVADSFTIQMTRIDINGVARVFTHLGCVVTEWSVSMEAQGLLKIKVSFDCQNVVTDEVADAIVYPADASDLFAWDQAWVEIDDVPTDVRTVELSGNRGLNTDRRYLRDSYLKKQPVRVDLPTYEGTMAMDFEGLTEYQKFTDGTPSKVTIIFQGQVLGLVGGAGADIPAEIRFTLPVCEYMGKSPTTSLGDLPTQELPFRVQHGAAGAAVQASLNTLDVVV